MIAKNLGFAFLLSLFSFLSFSQVSAPVLDWVSTFNAATSATVEYTAITTDDSGNVYLTGNFETTVDFDPDTGNSVNLTSNGFEDIIIQKLSPQGDLIWAKSVGGIYHDGGVSISVDSYGNVYTTGYYGFTVDFDPDTGTTQLTSATLISSSYVLKLDASGNFVWATPLNGSQTTASTSLVVDHSNNIIISGDFFGTTDFDPGIGVTNQTATGVNDMFIQKLDTSGALLWVNIIGDTIQESCQGVTIDQFDNILLVGYFDSIVDFDPGLGVYNLSAVNTDCFILKLSSTGSFTWVKSFEGSGGNTIGLSLSTDYQNNVIATGRFDSIADFDPGLGVYNLTSPSGFSQFVVKLDSIGDFTWANVTGSSINIFPIDLSIDTLGNTYITGKFTGVADFNPSSSVFNLTSLTTQSTYIQKLDTAGSFNWAMHINGSHNDGLSINIDDSNNIYACGSHFGSVDFDPSVDTLAVTASGLRAGYVVKYGICDFSYASISPTACNNYISPSGLHTWYYSGTYYDTLQNAIGCDSIITINLTVNSSYDTLTVAVCSTYTSPSGITLGNTGVYQDTSVNSLGCDSVITINLSVNNSTGTISTLSCGPYISPSGTYIWTTNGTYLDTIINAAGCDSIITINLTVGIPNTSTQNQVACDSYLWNANGISYTFSGTYSDTLVNSTGCDSIVTLNLTILYSNSSSVIVTNCDTFYWDADNTNYTSSGTYTTILTNQIGCDSTVTLDLTILKSTKNLISITACDEYIAPDGQVYTTNGTYTSILTNSVGCDSVITIYLLVTHIDSTVTLSGTKLTAASGSGYDYQWFSCDFSSPVSGATHQSYTPMYSGNYLVEISKGDCSATSDCIYVIISSVSELPLANISIYPNPTNGIIKIDRGNFSSLKIELIDYSGKKVRSTSASNQITQIDLGDLPTGIYLIKIENEFGVRYEKIIKQ